MHTHTLILLERLSSLTMSTTCTKNSEARTAKNPQSWTIESNLSRHCKKGLQVISQWIWHEGEKQAPCAAAYYECDSQHDWWNSEVLHLLAWCTQERAERTENLLETIFLYAGSSCRVKGFQLLTLKRQPSLLFQPWSLPANVDVEGSAVTPHVVRHSARKHKTKHL